MGSTKIKFGPTEVLAEQLAGVCEESHVRGRHEFLGKLTLLKSA